MQESIRRLQDTFFEHIEVMGPEATLTHPERDKLKAILEDNAFRKACALVFTEATMVGPTLVGINLTAPEGVGEAIRLQGKVMGMCRVFEGLFSLVEAIDEEEQEDGNSDE